MNTALLMRKQTLLLAAVLLLIHVEFSTAHRFSWSAAIKPIVSQHHYSSPTRQASYRQRLDLATADEVDNAVAESAVLRHNNKEKKRQLQQPSSAYIFKRRAREPAATALDESYSDQYQSEALAAIPCSHTKTITRSQTAFSSSSPAVGSKLPPPTPRHSTSTSQTRSSPSLTPTSTRALNFWENMFCGAISRSLAQTIMHPANSMKTMLQNDSTRGQSMLNLLQPKHLHRLTRGAGANLLLSVPSGAVNFAVLEMVRKRLGQLTENAKDSSKNSDRKLLQGPSLDFLSSCISTIACSVVSTPQMVITDNIMAGNYPHLAGAIQGIGGNMGIAGFYRGWWPGLVGKIPSYAITWTLFQQLKQLRTHMSQRPAKDWENAFMGCIASGTTVSILIPLDTIKTRLVTQMANAPNAYKGILDCAVRVAKEEGVGAFYRGLPPRLVSVVPMIGIQFGLYEFMRRTLLDRTVSDAIKERQQKLLDDGLYERDAVFEETLMEVAASADDPNPAPHFMKRFTNKNKSKRLLR
ncbi:hypothetical protein MPSEU_000818700 [Mayamaea pseudoterrestris]|nr:hypothetical protein MPSEU_000818700 [Mayamaea pseudoterrestris]